MTEIISARQATQNLSRGFAIINSEGMVQAVNPVLIQQAVDLGIPPGWSNIGFNMLEFLKEGSSPNFSPPHTLRYLFRHCRSVLRGHAPFFAIEFTIESPSARSLMLELSPFIRPFSSQVEGLLLTLTDVTFYKTLENSLRTALEEVRTLRGLLPICAVCKKIKDEDNQWTLIEEYLMRHTHAEFTHDICPQCIRNLYPKYASFLDVPDTPSDAD